jgi:hypothetical protein
MLEASVDAPLVSCTGKVVKVTRSRGDAILVKVKFDYDGDEQTYLLPKEAADLRLAPMRTGARVGIGDAHAADAEVRPKRWRCDGKDEGEHVSVTAAASPHSSCIGACERLRLCAARLPFVYSRFNACALMHRHSRLFHVAC